MRRIVMLIALLSGPTLAAEPTNYCNDPDINQRWADALVNYPNDPLVVRLAAQRDTLCTLLQDEEIDLERAQSLWDKALTDALLQRARAEQRERGLLPLFSTF